MEKQLALHSWGHHPHGSGDAAANWGSVEEVTNECPLYHFMLAKFKMRQSSLRTVVNFSLEEGIR